MRVTHRVSNPMSGRKQEIDAYCGNGGIETLHADISRALYQVANDLS
jgi:hypothetical protein